MVSKSLLLTCTGGLALLFTSAEVLASQLAATGSAPTSRSTSASETSALQDILVTAQRRSETLQRTAISISAITAEELSAASIGSVADLNGAVPGLVVGGKAGLGGSFQVSIRGISGQGSPLGIENPVGVYLDGVYLPRTEAAFFGLADVERIEVLRGPQGTLYGRNTTAGAINIITKKPSADFEGSVEGSFGSKEEYQARLYLSTPIIGGLAGSISLVKSGHGPYFVNGVTGNKVGTLNDFTGRGKLRYISDDGRFDATLSYDRTITNDQDFYQNIKDPITGCICGIGDPGVIYSVDLEDDVYTRRKSQGLALTMEYAVNDEVSVTSITSKRTFGINAFMDYDSLPLPAPYVQHTTVATSSEQFDQELRALYESDRITVVAGASYFHRKEYVLIGLNRPASFEDESDLVAYSAFANIDYKITDKLTFVLGGRYTDEKRDFSIDYSASVDVPLKVGTIKDSAFTPKIGLNYTANEDVFLYGLVSRGFQSGGFPVSPGAANPAIPFKPEHLTNYEIGAKTYSFNRRLRLNVTGFYMSYKDLQVRQILSGFTQTTNAGKATIYGVEAEGALSLGGGFSLTGDINYLHATYDDFIQLGIDRSGNWLSRAPKWQYSAGVHYEGEVSDGWELRADVSFSAQSRVYYEAANRPFVGNGGWHNIDARVQVTTPLGLSLYVFGKNLTDDRYLTQVGTTPANGIETHPSSVNLPRRFGIGARYEF